MRHLQRLIHAVVIGIAVLANWETAYSSRDMRRPLRSGEQLTMSLVDRAVREYIRLSSGDSQDLQILLYREVYGPNFPGPLETGGLKKEEYPELSGMWMWDEFRWPVWLVEHLNGYPRILDRLRPGLIYLFIRVESSGYVVTEIYVNSTTMYETRFVFVQESDGKIPVVKSSEMVMIKS